MKKGALSEIETCYLDTNRDKFTVEELAEKLDRTPATVKKYLKKLTDKIAEVEKAQQKENEENSAKEQQASQEAQISEDGTPIITFDQMMGKKSGAVVMTPAASQLSDELRKRNKPFSKESSVIHVIKKGKK